jgi:hypothetical protein
MFFKQVDVNQNERVIVSRNGKFVSILTPGTYRFIGWPGVSFETEIHNLSDPVFRSGWEEYLIEKPHIIATHFVVFETNESEIAMIFVDGMLHQVLLPGGRVLFWTDAASVSAEVVSIIDSELPDRTIALLDPEYQAEIDYLFSEP